jgi:hypothetical protein
VQREGARLPAELEGRVRAVGKTFVLAQILVDAADELAAEDRVHCDERIVVGRISRHRDMPDAQLRLRRASARNDIQPRRLQRSTERGRIAR